MNRIATLLVCFCTAAVPGYSQWVGYPTPGIPRLPDGKPNLSAPAPRNPDNTPDLSGVWAAECAVYGSDSCFIQSAFFDLAKDLKPEDVQMTPWAASIQAGREKRDHVDDPYGYCLPPGVPRIDYAGGPFKILHARGVTALLYETLVGMLFRQVFTDGRKLPENPDPSWLGYSVGRWENDTLVVETIGLRDGGWLDTRKAHPHSDALHLTERFRRVDFGHMELTITIDDRKAYLKPWTAKVALHLLPETDLLEAFCDGHEKTMEHRQIAPAPREPASVEIGPVNK